MTLLIVITCVIQIIAGLCVIFGRENTAWLVGFAGLYGLAYAIVRFLLVALLSSYRPEWMHIGPAWSYEVAMLLAAIPVAYGLVMLWVMFDMLFGADLLTRDLRALHPKQSDESSRAYRARIQRLHAELSSPKPVPRDSNGTVS